MPVTWPHRIRSIRYRRRRWIGRALVIIIVTVIAVPTVAGFVTTYALLYAPCSEMSLTPADYGHAWEDVTIEARDGGSFRGYLIAGTTGAVIVMPPPMAGGRGNRLHEADVLVRHGYAVLTFESRRCAGRGPLSLGYTEIDDVGDALAFLERHPAIDPERMGILGFSSAGATAIMAAARYPQLRAVVAEGGYGDFAEGVIGLHTRAPLLETLYKQAIAFSYRLLSGVDMGKLSPQDVIGTIAPRPVLLIYGSREQSLAGAHAQLAAAGEQATLWIVEGAGHGDYLAVAPDAYETRVVAFFDQALLGP